MFKNEKDAREQNLQEYNSAKFERREISFTFKCL